MGDALTNLLAFIVAISVLVAIHEYGHYIVGRWTGMKVLRFSIGFGRHTEAPAEIASFSQVERSFPLMAIIPVIGVEAFARWRINSMPSPSGKPRSTITTLGR